MSRGDRLFSAQLVATVGAGALTFAVVVLLSPSVPRIPAPRRAAAAASRGEESAPASGVATVVSGPAGGSARGPVAAWVERENARPGTAAWRIVGPQHAADIEGFAGAVSAVAGEGVSLYVSTVASSFHVEAYRMGYYGGLGGRLVWQSPPLAGERQAPSTRDPVTNMVEAPWQPSVRVAIDRSWPPGTYLFKLVGDGGQQAYVPLTVRDDTSTAAYVIQDSVTTWQAYNLWGGYSLYFGKNGRASDFTHRARVVSFDRPYYYGDGSGEFLNNELGLISLAESLGLDVTYWTDVDLHEHPERLLRHRALISLGHDEYWSSAMRDGAQAARDHGVNLAFLGANAIYRHIRFEASPLGADRRQIDYKSAREDPLFGRDNAEVTSQWREPPVPRPENQLIGDLYECNPVKADLVVNEPDAWVFADTGLTKGQHLKGVVGQEYDRYVPGPGVPTNVALLAHSPLRCRNLASYSDMTYYSAPSGAGVFATGTNWWISELGSACTDDPCVGKELTLITSNVLAAFGLGPAGLAHPSVASAGIPYRRPALVGPPVRRPVPTTRHSAAVPTTPGERPPVTAPPTTPTTKPRRTTTTRGHSTTT
jgi:hypothetical protein